MRLRNNCTDHPPTSRRSLRLALAVTLTCGSWSTVAADAPLPSLPQPLPSLSQPQSGATAGETDLLPYPFAGQGSRTDAAPQCQSATCSTAPTAGQPHVSRQLVRLLGLSCTAQKAAEQPHVAQPSAKPQAPSIALPTLPSLGLAGQLPTAPRSPAAPVLPASPPLPAGLQVSALPKPTTAPPAPKVVGSVVTASATEDAAAADTLAKDRSATDSSAGVPLPLPAEPVAQPAQPLSLGESLLDIEIPTDLVADAGARPVVQEAVRPASEAPVAKKAPPPQMKLSDVDDQPVAAPGPAKGIVEACEPPQLTAATPAKLASEPKVPAKQPHIVRPVKPLSLSLEPDDNEPATGGPGGAIAMNLNDAPPAAASKPPRGAALHSSSSTADGQQRASLSKAASSGSGGVKLHLDGDSLSEHLAMGELSRTPVPVAEAAVPDSPPTKIASASLAAPPAIGKRPVVPTSASQMLATQLPRASAPRASASALSVGLQESHTLSTEYAIAEVSVEHPHVCQLVKTSDHSVSVIGMQPGATRIALIRYDGKGERTVEVREVAVGDRAANAVNLSELAEDISQTVAQLYPKSDVQIIAHQDYVVVRGFTNYESDAKKILALVRKTSLAPVVDQLTTSGN